MLCISRKQLLRGGGTLAATKLFAPNIIKPAKAAFVLGKAAGGGGPVLLGQVDFKNGIYQWSGSSVSITTLVGNNLEYTLFDVAFISPGVGYTNGDNETQVALIGNAIASVTSGNIVVFDIIALNFGSYSADFYQSPSFDPDLTINLHGGFFGGASFTPINPNSGEHKFAFKSDGSTSASLSIDGGININDTGNVSPLSNAFGVDWFGAVIQSIKFYSGTSADLASLSSL